MDRQPVITLIRRYQIACSHQLHGLRPNHKCSRKHGHNYDIELYVRASRDLTNGMVLDAETLDVYVKPVLATIDHHDLNEIGESLTDPKGILKQPTVENLCRWLWEALAFVSTSSTAGQCQLVKIRIWETEKLAAEIEG